MAEDPERARPRLVLVPDSLFWITGAIAEQLARHNPELDAVVCSEYVFRRLLRRLGPDPLGADIVHFLTPHIAGSLGPKIADHVARVTTLLHVEVDSDVAPIAESDAVMTISRQWTDDLVARGVPPEKIGQVPLATDPERFRPAAPAEARHVRRQLGLDPDAFVVGFCAKRSSDTLDRKGTDVFARALERLARRRSGIASVILGPGWEEFARERSRAGVPCIALPFLIDPEELARAYRALDVFWVTSRIEGGPAPLLEAMASGICCVTTPVGVAPEVVVSRENAVSVPFDDPGAFADLTCELAASPELRARIGRAARRTIVRERSWSRCAPAAAELYRGALARSARRSGAREARPARRPNASPAPGLRRWMRAREHFAFSCALEALGDLDSAAALAGVARRTNPLDLGLWSHWAALELRRRRR